MLLFPFVGISKIRPRTFFPVLVNISFVMKKENSLRSFSSGAYLVRISGGTLRSYPLIKPLKHRTVSFLRGDNVVFVKLFHIASNQMDLELPLEINIL